MDRIDGFWAGAQDHAGGLDLPALATAAGGWAALRAASVGDLVALGVEPATANLWRAARPRETMGWALTLEDEAYPPALRSTRRPPPVVFGEGDRAALGGPAVAVVGTRACTRYGRGVARHLGTALATAGFTVVSGLARGVDAEAHRGALRGGRTVAVLGHGLAHTAPASHRSLRAELVAAGGAVVSTWPDRLPPRPHTFPRRNLWIAGLSAATVVVEAARRSGALITAREAASEGRDVYAVPGPIGAEASAGCLQLLADGASVVTDVGDLVARLGGRGAVDWAPWLEELFAGASVDVVARRHGRSSVELLSELTRLELAGDVVRLVGQRYAPGGGRS